VSHYTEGVVNNLKKKYYWESEFLQAAEEVINSLSQFIDENPRYRKLCILDQMIEPERIIIFRVPWQDDRGVIQVNTGYRVEFNSALGPYKGGLRFHPSVNMGILKFLGFEQIFKNSLTGLPLGGGKGGSDFDPKGKSDFEVMHFCQSFMNELYRHLGTHTDVPAGDIGVGGREIGYLFGQYKKLTNRFEGVLTGKGLNWGGSLIRPEATGYGAVYFAEEMLKTREESIRGKTVLISGSGNVAQYALQKINLLGGKVISLSDSSGTIIDKEGIDEEKWHFVLDLKNNRRGRIEEYSQKYSCSYYEGKRPWTLAEADIVLPCAIQNEINLEEMKSLIQNGCFCICEGANMPTTPDAKEFALAKGILFGPGKAANAGGVATSGLEMAQNSMRMKWTRNEVDTKLHQIMVSIHKSCLEAAEMADNPGNYVLGANLAGFKKVADAMIDQGII